jgi:hypothetical protein
LSRNARGIFTEPLPNNDKGVHIQTHILMGGIFLIRPIDTGSDAVIYVTSFIKIGSGIQKFIRGIHRHTHTHTHTYRQQHDLISLLYF